MGYINKLLNINKLRAKVKKFNNICHFVLKQKNICICCKVSDIFKNVNIFTFFVFDYFSNNYEIMRDQRLNNYPTEQLCEIESGAPNKFSKKY